MKRHPQIAGPRGLEAPGHAVPLPKSYATHWVASRKAQVVQAVQNGLITLDEALSRYRLSLEEFRSWQRALRRDGLHGLAAKHAHVQTLARRTVRRLRPRPTDARSARPQGAGA